MRPWMEITTPEDLVKLIEEKHYVNTDKWTAFRYFACSQNENEHSFFIELLNSPQFDIVELLNKYNSRIYHFENPESVELIIRKIEDTYLYGTNEQKEAIENAATGWRYIKDAHRLAWLVDNGKIDSRWMVLKHYAGSLRKIDEEFFKTLINTNFVSVDSIIRSFQQQNEEIWKNPSNREFAQKHIEQNMWQKGADKILKKQKLIGQSALELDVKNLERTVAGRQKIYEYLTFFAYQDDEVFNSIVKRVSPSILGEWFFTGSKTEQEKQCVQKIVLNNKPVMLNIKATELSSKMDYDPKFIHAMRTEKQFKDWEFFRELASVPGTEEELIKFLATDIVSKEKIKERFSTGQIMAFHKPVQDFVKDNEWKYFNNLAFVKRRITAENKWQILEYYLVQDAEFAKLLIRETMSYKPYVIYNEYKTQDLSRLDPAASEYISKLINKIDLQKQKVKQRREEQKKLKSENLPDELVKWIDKERGCLKHFFYIYKNKAILTIEDYRQIAYHYIESGLTVRAYTAKYKLSSEEGLKKMLNLVAEEDANFKEKLKDLWSNNSRRFNAHQKSVIEGVVVGKISVEQLIDGAYPQTLKDFIGYINSTYDNPKVGAIFVHRIILYYYQRLNEYDGKIELESLNKLLKNKEANFILSSSELIDMKKTGKAEIGDIFYSAIKPYAYSLKGLMEKAVNGSGKEKIRNKLDFYNDAYRPNKLNGSLIGSYNFGTIKVTEEILASAEEYAKNNNIFMTETTMTRIIRAIAEGKISKTPTKQTKASCRTNEELLEKARETESVQEYLSILSGIVISGTENTEE